MTALNIVVITASLSGTICWAAAMFFCFFHKGGIRDLRSELNAEVELNVKILKEKYDWILERAKFRRTMRDPIKLAAILELAKMIDASIPEDLSASSADCCPAQGDAGVVSENSRASVSPAKEGDA
jgi:hypothetical protein